MKSILLKSEIVLSLLLAFIISVPLASAAEKPVRVAVLPFAIHAEKDLSFLKQGIVDMLSTRLAWEGKVQVASREEVATAYPEGTGQLTEPEAKEIGRGMGVDYVLFGSLTVFGNSVSVDAKMADISGARPTLTFFNQSQGMDEVIPRINQFAEKVNAEVFGRQTAIAALPQQAPAEAAPAQTPSIYAHPEKMLEPELRKGAMVKEGTSPFVVERTPEEGGGFWKSPNIAEELKGLALADVDGDGRNETVLLTSGKVLIYRLEAGRFIKKGEYSAESYKYLIGVDAADVKKDGRAEIFVTSLDTSANRLDSFVLEWEQNKPVAVATGLNWYFRVINHPARGPLLMGQKRGATELFVGGIYELEWTGSTYDAGSPAEVRGASTVFSFSIGDFTGDGREMVIAFDKHDQLRLLTPAGEREWVSKEAYGGSENYMELTMPGTGTDKTEQPFYVPQRIVVTDLTKDGLSQVVVVKNDAFAGRLFHRYRRYDGAQFEALSWDGVGLSPEWHTRKVSGYVSDYAVGDFDNDGRPDLVAALVLKRDAVLGKPRSSVIAYDLSPMMGGK